MVASKRVPNEVSGARLTSGMMRCGNWVEMSAVRAGVPSVSVKRVVERIIGNLRPKRYSTIGVVEWMRKFFTVCSLIQILYFIIGVQRCSCMT